MVRLSEFQAVILCGYGQRLSHLVDETPKPLLPIANKPMILKVLQWLESGGISHIYVVSTPESTSSLSHFLSKVYLARYLLLSKVYESQGAGSRIELVTPEAYGTADALRAVIDKIKSDVIVVSCDLMTDVKLSALINMYRLNDPSMLCLFTNTPKYDPTGLSNPPLYTGLDSANQRILLMDSREFSDEDQYSYVDVHMPVLDKYGMVNVYSNLQDSHFYIVKRWLLDWIASQKEVSSIREDLVPLLVKAQHSKILRNQLGLEKYLSQTHADNEVHNDDMISSAIRMLSMKDKQPILTSPPRTSSANSQLVSPEEDESARLELSVLTYVLMGNDTSSTSSYCIRVNTVPTYFELNKLAAKCSAVTVAPTAEVPSNSQVGNDSVVGDGTKVGERCSIKKSVIGAHCTIAKNAKIVNSVVMDYVVIEENVKIEGCIISNGAHIKAKSSLKDCEVGTKFMVESGTNAKGEQFIESRVISADEEEF